MKWYCFLIFSYSYFLSGILKPSNHSPTSHYQSEGLWTVSRVASLLVISSLSEGHVPTQICFPVFSIFENNVPHSARAGAPPVHFYMQMLG